MDTYLLRYYEKIEFWITLKTLNYLWKKKNQLTLYVTKSLTKISVCDVSFTYQGLKFLSNIDITKRHQTFSTHEVWR